MGQDVRDVIVEAVAFGQSMDFANTLGAEHMGWSLRVSRVGCSVAIVKEILMKFGKRYGMLFDVEGFVHKQCKGFWRFWWRKSHFNCSAIRCATFMSANKYGRAARN